MHGPVLSSAGDIVVTETTLAPPLQGSKSMGRIQICSWTVRTLNGLGWDERIWGSRTAQRATYISLGSRRACWKWCHLEVSLEVEEDLTRGRGWEGCSKQEEQPLPRPRQEGEYVVVRESKILFSVAIVGLLDLGSIAASAASFCLKDLIDSWACRSWQVPWTTFKPDSATVVG